MADPWAVVSTQPIEAPAPQIAPQEADPWAVVDHAPMEPPKLRGAVSNVGAGMNEAIAGTLGAPVDAANAVLRGLQNEPKLGEKKYGLPTPATFLGYVARLLPDASDEPFGGSKSIKKGLGVIGADPEDVEAKTPGERIARGAGAGAASMVLPFGAARAAAELGASGPMIDTLGSGSLKSNATIGAASGAGGEGAAEVVPEPYKSTARLAGSLLAGGAAAAGTTGAKSVVDATGSAIKRAAAPLTEAGREQLAGERIAAASSDAGALPGKLDVENPELVEGSKPTTYQISGDQGMGQLERAARTRKAEPFIERAGEQNAARVGAIENLALAEAKPGAVGDFFRGQLDNIDAAHDQAIDAARTRTTDTIENLGGVKTPAEYGAAAREAVTRNYAPVFGAHEAAVSEAEKNVHDAVSAMGGEGAQGSDDQVKTALQQYGSTIRQHIADANMTAKKRERALWNAVDPDGSLAINASPIPGAVDEIKGSMAKTAEPMDAREAAIFDTAKTLSGVAPFSEVTALRSRLQSAIRDERFLRGGESPALRRMGMLQDSIDDTIGSAVDRQTQQQSAAVRRGEMAEPDTIASRLQDQIRAWYGARDAAGEAGTGTGDGIGIQGSAGTRPVATPRASGTTEPAAGESGSLAGNSSLPLAETITPQQSTGKIERIADLQAERGAEERGERVAGSPAQSFAEIARGQSQQPLVANFDEDAAQRYADARRATRERKQTFKSGPVGQAIAPGQAGADYRIGDSQVASRFFNSGTKAADDVQSFVNAMGDRDGALQSLQDYAAFDLRRAAERADGTLNPLAYQRWMKAHDEALSAFPELRQKFETAGNAQQVLDDVNSQRQTLERAYPIKPGGADAEIMPRYWKPGDAGAEAVESFARDTGGHPEAMANLHDYAAFSLRKAAERPDGTLDMGRYQTWMKRYDSALSAAPEVRAQFATAEQAQNALDQTLAAKVATRQAYEDSAARFFLKAEPEIAVRRALASSNPSETFAELAAMTKGDPAASAGLRRAVVDHIAESLTGNAEGADTGINLIKSDQFQTFVRKNAKALGQIFTPEQIQSMEAVAADLQRANRSIAGSKLPGGSNTPQDVAGAARHIGTGSILSRAVVNATAAALGHLAVPGLGGPFLGYIGSTAAMALRAAGVGRVDDLVAQAMLNPELARTLLMKVPHVTPALSSRLAQQLRSTALVTAAQNAGIPSPSDQRPRGFRRGGRITADDLGKTTRPVKIKTGDDIAMAERHVETDPSDAQKKSGVYQKGHLQLHGLNITIETPKGETRRGVGADGRPWESASPAAYGYLKRTEGADGDNVDAYVGDHPASTQAFIVDQHDPKSGAFDEHKIVLGARDRDEALKIYDGGFSDGSGPTRRPAISEIPIAGLKKWLADGDTKKPISTVDLAKGGPVHSFGEVVHEHNAPHVRVADAVLSQLDHGPVTPHLLKKMVEKAADGSKHDGDDLADALNLGVSKFIRKYGAHFDPRLHGIKARQALQRLVALKGALPKGDNAKAMPPDYGFIANWAANLGGHDTVLDPMAGTGSMIAHALNATPHVMANEPSDKQARLLSHLDHRQQLRGDPAALDLGNEKPSVVLLHAPDGSGAALGHAMDHVAPEGRVVAVMGHDMEPDHPTMKEIGKQHRIGANIKITDPTFMRRIIVADKLEPTDQDKLTVATAKNAHEALNHLSAIRYARSGRKAAS